MDLIISRSIAYHSGKIFVGDIGKNRVFVLDGTMDVETVGETGNGRLQFKVLRFWADPLCCDFYKEVLLQGPTCLVADSEGSILVVDSHNHRIQLINPDYTFAAVVKVTEHFTLEQPSQSRCQRPHNHKPKKTRPKPVLNPIWGGGLET